jgi:N-acetylmuramoyl-L-alanine amidase
MHSLSIPKANPSRYRGELDKQRKGMRFCFSVHHDSVQPRYLKEWEVNGKTQLYSDEFKGFSIFFSRRNPKFAESFQFARLLGAAMVARGFSPTLHHAEQIPGESRNLVDEDFGLYEFDNLIVLKTAAMPAALLECGVIVSRNEEASLQTPEIQHRIADAAAEAIVQSLGSAGLARHQLQLAPANASEPRPSHKSRRQRKAS